MPFAIEWEMPLKLEKFRWLRVESALHSVLQYSLQLHSHSQSHSQLQFVMCGTRHFLRLTSGN